MCKNVLSVRITVGPLSVRALICKNAGYYFKLTQSVGDNVIVLVLQTWHF